QNRYVQGVKKDGTVYTRNWLDHFELQKGGKIELQMGDRPATWGAADADVPYSFSTQNKK
ncbi:MAG TPA: hypothetical protein PKL81_10685, partial [Ferruginibacter sp.]|nr:hypothetical protein [Ferruginibacter sp.]